MSARAKRPAPVIAGSATGQLRVEQILETARTILVRDGHAGLSMRKVAQESGIALGHLQHFFATREALLNGLFRYA
ncbi:MAG: TetR family transcriptional regulator, partial [Amphiplicatus sp.]|nr:TetR family transcriptional regulator [Amphiplicatus sp.]